MSESNNKVQNDTEITLVNNELVKESFEKNIDSEFDKDKIKTIMNLELSLGKKSNDDENTVALKITLKIDRIVNVEDCENKQLYLEVTFISIYKVGSEIFNNLEVLDQYSAEFKNITNEMLELSYPSIKEHITRVLEKAKIKIGLPKKLEWAKK